LSHASNQNVQSWDRKDNFEDVFFYFIRSNVFCTRVVSIFAISFAKAATPYTHKPFHTANFASRLIRRSYNAKGHIYAHVSSPDQD